MIFADIKSKLLIKELRIGEIYILTYAAPFGDGTIFDVVNVLHLLASENLMISRIMLRDK